MSSGGKGRSNRGPKGGTDRNSGGGSTHSHQTKSDHNHNEKDRDSMPHKIAPTADQLRIAQMIDHTHPEKVLHEKINQVTQVTGVSTDDAIVALHDCDNDVNAAIDSLLEGEDQGEWRESTKKKKKAPAAKSKEEAESNKENRRLENRERSNSRPRGGAGGPPRFRGGRGGRGGREETSEGVGRGSGGGGGRRGRMANGIGGAARGRGTRGRGASALNARTFQKRQPQPPGFTETIDTWASTPADKAENSANNLQIDNWDDERSTNTTGTEDWDGEWTGSLDKTTVFSPSTSIGPSSLTGAPAAQPEPSPSAVPPVANHSSPISGSGAMSTVLGPQVTVSSSSSSSSGSSSLPPPPPLPDSVSSVLSMGAPPMPSVSSMNVPPPQSYSNVSPSNSISQAQTIDLAALLQKAAPHSTLGRLPPTPMGDGGMGAASLGGVEAKSNLLSNLGASVGDPLKGGMLSGSGVSSSVVSSAPPPQSYSPSSSAISNSMFSNSGSNLGSSLSSNSAVSKVLNLSSQNASLASRSKPARSRLPHTSKIPSKAVEMPEVAMAALDMQFTGLEFGTETFDFTSDMKPLMGSSLVSGSSVNSRGDSSSVVPVSVSKDLSSLSSTISQQQPQSQLGPQPIPFPSQSAERKTQSSILSGGGPSRPSVVASASASAQSLADLTKKDTSASGGNALGTLVGSTPSGHSPYQSSASAGYGPKTSSFPSPPAHYTQNPSQNYSSSTSSGVNNSSYAGTSVNSSSGGGGSSSSSSNQSGAGYGSSFSAQASASSGQYQNNYVNVSSHSLASMNVSKSHGGLKDSSQNYNDTSGTASSLSGSLSTSAGGSNSGSGLSASLNSAPPSSVQPSKSSVPGMGRIQLNGKTVNSLGSSVPPGVQQHSVSQHQQQQQHQVGQQQQLNQHHQSHHHLQQQQQQQQQVAQQTQQTQQLMAGPSQYVSPQQAALQGALPPPFYNVQQPAMYSFEDLQVFQQRITHVPQAPTSLPGGREGAITSPPSYSVAEANKFRTDQNSSPVPSTMNQQGGAAGATYITAPGNAAMAPFYMYQTMPAVPNTFSQYGAPAIIQIPSNNHTASNTTQFPGPPKIQYGGASTYYDNMTQTQDYKAGYGSGSQGQNKTGPNSTGSASNSGSDLTGYKNHLGKVGRAYEKPTFHTGTPPPYSLAGSGTSPMTANYPPMFIPTMPATAPHHSPLMHHQLHQDGGSSGGQRTATGGGQNKGGSKGSYTGSYWTN